MGGASSRNPARQPRPGGSGRRRGKVRTPGLTRLHRVPLTVELLSVCGNLRERRDGHHGLATGTINFQPSARFVNLDVLFTMRTFKTDIHNPNYIVRCTLAK